MKLTIQITKTKLALVVGTVALAGTTAALAGHPFTDVESGKWYSDAVEWAYDNDITTGKTDTSFDGNAGVTRYEAVTFQQRYDENVAAPARAALADDIATNTSGVADNAGDIATNTSDIAALPTFHRASVDDDGTLLSGTAGISSSRTSEGDYLVDFGTTDVSGCNWTATMRFDAAILITGDGMLTLNSVYTFDGGFILDEEVIWVQTFAQDGTEDDIPFDLLVIC